jgi:ABC-type tungstate transport system permease subunit
MSPNLDPDAGMYYVETPAGIVAVWETALQARGYTLDDAGAQALAYDLITGEIAE